MNSSRKQEYSLKIQDDLAPEKQPDKFILVECVYLPSGAPPSLIRASRSPARQKRQQAPSRRAAPSRTTSACSGIDRLADNECGQFGVRSRGIGSQPSRAVAHAIKLVSTAAGASCCTRTAGRPSGGGTCGAIGRALRAEQAEWWRRGQGGQNGMVAVAWARRPGHHGCTTG